jgi:hypothetical protein
MVRLGWLGNDWDMCDRYIEVLLVFTANLGPPGIEKALPKLH